MPNPDFRSPAEQWRASWQGRILRIAIGDKNKTGGALLSVLADSFGDDLEVLLRAVVPGFAGIVAPFFCSSARVVKSGHVCADLIDRAGRLIRRFPIFRDKKEMEGEFRRLADRAGLTDVERVEFFTCVGKWLVCDERLDPTLDRADPDVARLTEPGMKLAHDPLKD